MAILLMAILIMAITIIMVILMFSVMMLILAGAYSGPHERRLLHDLMDQYNKVN